jgi:hypothetical protein
MFNPFEVLGIKDTASMEEIESAYHTSIKKELAKGEAKANTDIIHEAYAYIQNNYLVRPNVDSNQKEFRSLATKGSQNVEPKITNHPSKVQKQPNLLSKIEINRATARVIKTGSAEEIYNFARNTKGVSIRRLARAIIKIGDPYFMLRMAHDYKSVRPKMIKEIIKTGNSECIYRITDFYTNKRPPVEKIAKYIMNGCTADEINHFAGRYATYKDIHDYGQAIINTGAAEVIYNFYLWSKDYYQMPVKPYVIAICKSNNAKYIYQFAKDIPSPYVNELAETLINTKNGFYICEFAKNVVNAPMEKLAEGIVGTKNPRYIYDFALLIKEAPISELANAIIATNNLFWICEFMKIKNAPIDKLYQVIMDSNDIAYIDNMKKLLPSIANYNSDVENMLPNDEIIQKPKEITKKNNNGIPKRLAKTMSLNN